MTPTPHSPGQARGGGGHPRGAPAFEALNLAAGFYLTRKATKLDGNVRALRNLRKRVREMRAILADADLPTPKQVKNIRFLKHQMREFKLRQIGNRVSKHNTSQLQIFRQPA